MNVIVAVLEPTGPRLAAAAAPLLRADDLGAARGDGAFETMHVRSGDAWLLDAHLDRLTGSLRRLEIAMPERGQLAALITTAIAGWEDAHIGGAPEAGVKLIVTRGPEFTSEPATTAYAVVFPIQPAMLAARDRGVKLAALSWGFPADERARSPWLLGGVKSVSYAQNMAVLREAARRGGDDALLISSDGIVLEAPTAGFVWQRGETLYATPLDTGILASTTVAYLFDNLQKLGLTSGFERIALTDVGGVDGAWLISSVRGVVPVTAVITDTDTIELPQSTLTEGLRELAMF